MEAKSYERRDEDGNRVSDQSGGRIEIDKPGHVMEIGPDDELVVLVTRGQRIIRDILEERERQDEKWGPVPRLNHDFGHWLKILMEEIGEASAAELEVDFYEGEISPIFIQEVDDELTQAAAILVAWLEHRAALREQQREA